MSERIYNFSAGPAILPESVLRKAQDALWTLGDSGVGILEHSHRGAEFTAIIERAEATCRELAGIPDTYRVLFLQGGASSQFFTLPMNLLDSDGTADYIETGTWSTKAIKEARRFGQVHIAASGQDSSFTRLPTAAEVNFSSAPTYVHMTGNNTIRGTEFAEDFAAALAIPGGAPLCCDASSNIFSRPIDITRYGMVYAGAQKNLGPSGLTLVIIDDALVERGAESLPTMLQYRTHVAKGSRFNTPPTFAIFVLDAVLTWIRDFGGLAAMAEYNRAKAAVIYDFLDDSELFQALVEPASRSHMNICFRSVRPELEAQFLAEATRRGLAGLAGHRSVGGMRASVYNAFPSEGCAALIEFLKEFERANR